MDNTLAKNKQTENTKQYLYGWIPLEVSEKICILWDLDKTTLYT